MGDVSLYIKGTGHRKTYGFGPPVVATMMWVDDFGFPTEDEAVLYWYHHVWKKEREHDKDKADD